MLKYTALIINMCTTDLFVLIIKLCLDRVGIF